MVVCLSLGTSPAFAEPWSQEELDAWASEVVPQVEAAVGRSFQAPPRIVLTTTEEVRRRQEREIVAEAPEGSTFVESVKEQAASVGAIAMLDRDTVFVLGDALSSVPLPDGLVDAVGRGVLAHELTHALQTEGPRPELRSEGQRAAWQAVMEGQAEWVAEQVCLARGDRGAVGWLRAMTGTTVLSPGPLDDVIVRYGWGRAYAALVVEGGGTPALWDAYAHPPGSVTDLIAQVRRAEPASSDAAEVRAALGTLLASTTSRPDRAALAALWVGDGAAGFEAAAVATGAEAWVATDDEGTTAEIVAVRFSDPGVISPLVLARRQQVVAERRDRQGVLRPFVALEKRMPVDGTLVVHTWSDSKIREYWAFRGGRLVVVRTTGRDLSSPTVAGVVADLLPAPS